MDSLTLNALLTVGGSALAAIITAIGSWNKTRSEAVDSSIMHLLQIDDRMKQRVESLENEIDALRRENSELRLAAIESQTKAAKLKVMLERCISEKGGNDGDRQIEVLAE